jgi:hypothetical protein
LRTRPSAARQGKKEATTHRYEIFGKRSKVLALLLFLRHRKTSLQHSEVSQFAKLGYYPTVGPLTSTPFEIAFAIATSQRYPAPPERAHPKTWRSDARFESPDLVHSDLERTKRTDA